MVEKLHSIFIFDVISRKVAANKKENSNNFHKWKKKIFSDTFKIAAKNWDSIFIIAYSLAHEWIFFYRMERYKKYGLYDTNTFSTWLVILRVPK